MGAALAAPGFTTGNVNMRAGPDTAYPRVTVIPPGQPVEIVGCLYNQSWCDVIWGRARGWVYGEYLGFAYQGRTVLVPEYAPVIGIPVVGFNFNNYWGTYYRGSPWWGQYGRWQYYQPRPRPGWGPPPPGPGPRPPGWWHGGPGPQPYYRGQPGWNGGYGRPPGPPPGPPPGQYPPGQYAPGHYPQGQYPLAPNAPRPNQYQVAPPPQRPPPQQYQTAPNPPRPQPQLVNPQGQYPRAPNAPPCPPQGCPPGQ
ncbi:SH3 domain-containing protein [Azorhizobium caulinodans]|uniref:SH3 domain-containing protein n=1 Tax=Azorhizobium caulinodans TaxID=7 RepID=UPI002FBDF4C1